MCYAIGVPQGEVSENSPQCCRNTPQCTEGAQVFYDFVNKVSADMYPLLWQPRYELSRIPLLDQRDAETEGYRSELCLV